jgi:hypothetical protein
MPFSKYVVDPNQVAALRKAPRDGSGGNRYLVNVPGRDYCFVAPVTFEEDPQGAQNYIERKDGEAVLQAPRRPTVRCAYRVGAAASDARAGVLTAAGPMIPEQRFLKLKVACSNQAGTANKISLLCGWRQRTKRISLRIVSLG